MNQNSSINYQIHMEAVNMEKIAKNFASGSSEWKSLKKCMLAYGFALTRHKKEFENYLRDLDRNPSPEELKLLEKYCDIPHDDKK